ncbi:ras-related protein Rab-21-like isoform X1 [Portunus trituberculatus]|uniref:ras-related protein Rab-21-like isoform X1 n=1 Tax=Portunus trituberculatus TaxID=210409 RepID=UPI001E1CB997|nr:ras-related protein Rab-21-like isoform X1 [Portunus trituberculatus]XP_045104847.1 ras-related protein Rab-21-like isoform X1 [Portunus trituberculatus]
MKTVAVKIVILGSQGVGKTSLVTRYETKSFQKNTSSTIGASFSNVDAIIDDVKVKMQVWDTAGQERFRSMAPMYYRGANAALLVFDLTKYDTFTDVKAWAHELTHRVEGELMLVVVGNKVDLAEQRVVQAATARNYAASIGAPFFETSALDNTGVQEMFQEVAARMVQQAETNTNSSLRVYAAEQGKDRRGSILQLSEDSGERAKGGGCC